MDKAILIENHRILNYLYATYQGKFTALNILAQFKDPNFREVELQNTKADLKIIRKWLDDLKDNEIVIFKGDNSSETQQKKAQIYQMLKILKPELEKISYWIEECLIDERYGKDLDKIKKLIGCFGRYAYSRDNYIRGFIEFAHLAEGEDVVHSYHLQLNGTSSDTKLTHQLVSMMKNPEQLQKNFFHHLHFFSRIVPGAFRANVHDINQFLAIEDSDFTFAQAEFTKEEEESAKHAGFGPIEAGYWKAHKISIDDALIWGDLVVDEPFVAASWRMALFTPETAVGWIAIGFTPILAIQWVNAGFNPLQAAVLLEAGYKHPSELPQDIDKINEILKKLLPEEEKEDIKIEEVNEGEESMEPLKNDPVDDPIIEDKVALQDFQDNIPSHSKSMLQELLPKEKLDQIKSTSNGDIPFKIKKPTEEDDKN